MHINIDYDTLAKGWLKILGEIDKVSDEENITMLSIGLLPKIHFENLIDRMIIKVAQMHIANDKELRFLDFEEVKKVVDEEGRTHINEKMTNAVFKNANTVA